MKSFLLIFIVSFFLLFIIHPLLSLAVTDDSSSITSFQHVGVASLAIYALLQTIVRITPTKKDDRIVSKIGKFLNWLFLSNNSS